MDLPSLCICHIYVTVEGLWECLRVRKSVAITDLAFIVEMYSKYFNLIQPTSLVEGSSPNYQKIH